MLFFEDCLRSGILFLKSIPTFSLQIKQLPKLLKILVRIANFYCCNKFLKPATQCLHKGFIDRFLSMCPSVPVASSSVVAPLAMTLGIEIQCQAF